MTLKGVRRTLEGDLGLPAKALDEQKDVVTRLLDAVLLVRAHHGRRSRKFDCNCRISAPKCLCDAC
jgi:hypothetical protein